MTRTLTLVCLLTLWIGGWALAQPVWMQDKAGTPGARYHHGMAWDGYNGHVFLYGGRRNSAVVLHDAWKWTNSGWSTVKQNTAKPLVTYPGSRWQHAMVGAGKKIILFGGNQGNSFSQLADTWAWTGTGWTKMPTSGGPSARNEAAMAYFAVRGVVLLVGGYHAVQFGKTTVWGDVWELDPIAGSWKSLPHSTNPPPRYGAAMAYDANRKRVVLFGGFDGTTHLADTWEWDGKAWTKMMPLTSPPGRLRHQMVYDPDRKRVVLIAGSGKNPNQVYFNDTWEWDGHNWTQLRMPNPPAGRQSLRATWHATRRCIVTQGGQKGSIVHADTWKQWTRNPATITVSGKGCKGSHGKVPLLSAVRTPVIDRTFGLQLTVAVPNSLTLLVIGLHQAKLDLGAHGAPGCMLYLVPQMSVYQRADKNGGWSLPNSFRLPNAPVLLGQKAFFQVGVIDAKANKLGLITSNALEARVGY